MGRITITKLKELKENEEKITMVTAYDYSMAQLVDQAGVECILVGDSLGMVVLGYESTLPVTMEDMIHHTKAVVRGSKNALVIGDMPFMSYHVSVEESVRNAGRFIKEAGAQAIKLEGGREVLDSVKAICRAGIPVMGHLGLTPQQIHQLGGFKVQGKDETTAKKMIEDAKMLEDAGAFGIVLECVPAPLAKIITEQLSIPTIGIGAGVDCDGQVLVSNDLLGMFKDFVPKFVKQYANLKDDINTALQGYIQEVKESKFPAEMHSFSINSKTLKQLY